MNMIVLCREFELAFPERRALESSACQLEQCFRSIVRVEWKLKASGGTHTQPTSAFLGEVPHASAILPTSALRTA